MSAIKFETTVNEATAGAMPELRPFLGRRVQLVALDADSSSAPARNRISLGEFLHKYRLRRPEGVAPLSVQDMEKAIEHGARGGNV